MNQTCSIPLSCEHERAVLRVVRSGVLVAGPETDALEEEFAAWLNVDRDRVVALSSGTAALEALLLAHGVGPGDEVIIPAVTFTATGLAVLRVGARPVLADISPTFTLSPESTRDLLSESTAAVIGVDLDGAAADWRGLEQVVGESVPLIEDACPAYGARAFGREAGTLGRDGAAFSMNESKQLPAGEGGLVVAPHSALAGRIRRMRHFGHDPSVHFGAQGLAVEPTGDNWKITELAAALARASLPTLRTRVMNSRLIGETIRVALQKSSVLSPVPQMADSEPSWYRLRALVPDVVTKLGVMVALREGGVGLTATEEVAPLYRQPMFAGCRRGELPNASQASRSFCLGSRQKQVFAIDHSEAVRWAEVITSLPSKLVSPRSKEEA